ncbi:DNA-directed RNA polymerase III subunit RPC7 isoform X1 [Phyllostomus discolor]|uniref:DNA-directed RNA polymerase III subunit RPC7 isoform X1 n=2 Tax=Phyllostomus discolor TaxID=89673 RepID=A0A7E6DAT6_9CHIR|nr:DNA-directed RNA polymerase III subunit RPC7 isoform X1 [Phyllostomus discolor]
MAALRAERASPAVESVRDCRSLESGSFLSLPTFRLLFCPSLEALVLSEQNLPTFLVQLVAMAGNKGRGRAAYTFNIEAVGFNRGEKLPDVVLKPPPLFPDTDYKPVPLKTGEGEDYMLALKQELRETVKRMPYFIETPEEKEDIERYSKRYMKVYKEEWIPDWRRLPREMMPKKKYKKAGSKSKKVDNTSKDTSLTNTADVLKKIEELEKRGDGEKSDEENEEKEGSKEKNKEGDEDEEDDAVEQEEYDEEEHEEENDYINSYFDNGEDFGADSDDNMDEATY